MLSGVSVVLVRTRFPENIGMAARAMANMGVSRLVLVESERFDMDKAGPAATSQGLKILEQATVCANLAEAVRSEQAVIGSTARTGGRRMALLSPEQAAGAVRAITRDQGRVAFVFGSEDKGLLNSEVDLCTHLVNIPAFVEHTSFNLAQAVLLVLYECAKANLFLPFSPAAGRTWNKPSTRHESRRITADEEAMLFSTLEDVLISIGHLDSSNPAWFMQPMRRFLRRSGLRRHEHDMLMGICRQVKILTRK